IGSSGYYSPGDYYNRLKAYWDAIRAAGGKLIVCTVLPKGSAADEGGAGGAFEAGRVTLNNLIRSDPSLYDGLADFAAHPQMGVAGAPDLHPTLYAADGVHPLAAGHALLA